MQLPYLSSNLLVWVDPAERFVQKNAKRKVICALNRLNGSPIKQLVESKQPLWNPTAINNTPGLVFSGAQRLTLNLPPSAVSSKPLNVTFASQFDVVTGNIALEIGSSTNTSLAGLGIGFDTGSDLVEPYLFADDSSGGAANFENVLDNKAHVWSVLFDLHSIITRKDGVIVNETAMPDVSSFHFNSITLGDVNFDSTNPLDHFYFTGNIGTVLIYQGDKIHSAVEEYVMNSAGL